MTSTIPPNLLANVAEAFGLTPADLIGRGRMHIVVEARQAAAWVLRQSCPALALADIGRLLHRDHTTIIYSLQQIERKMAGDPQLRATLHSLLPQRPMAAPPRSRIDHAMRWWAQASRDSFFVRTA